MHSASTWIVTTLIAASLLITACAKEAENSEASKDTLEKLNSESLPEIAKIFQELKELVEYSIDDSPIQRPAAEMSYKLNSLYLIEEKIWMHDCTLTTETHWDAQNSAASFRDRPKSEHNTLVFNNSVDLRYVDQEDTKQLESDKLAMIRNHAIDMRRTFVPKGMSSAGDFHIVYFPTHEPTNPVYRRFDNNNKNKYEPKIYKKRSFNFKIGWAYSEDQPEIKEAFGKLTSVCQDQDTIDKIHEMEVYRVKLLTENPEAAERHTLETELINVPNWLKDLWMRDIIPGVGMAGIKLGEPVDQVIAKYGTPNSDKEAAINTLSGGTEKHRLVKYLYRGGFLSFLADNNNRISTISGAIPMDYAYRFPRIVGLTTERADTYDEIKSSLGYLKAKYLVYGPKKSSFQKTTYNYSGFGLRVYNDAPDIPKKYPGRILLVGIPQDNYSEKSKFKVLKDFKKTVEISSNQKRIAADLLTAYGEDLNRLNSVADHVDYAVLAAAAYGTHESLKIAEDRGWKPLKTFVDNNITVGDTVATLFVSENGEHVLAFRGTKTLGDWVTNIKGSLSVKELDNLQIEGARKIARENARLKDLTFVGHSLGGRLAQVARYETNDPAVVFNTAPLGANELVKLVAGGKKPSAPKTSFKSPEDPLSSLFSPKDTEVSNIERVEGGALADLVTADYTHSMNVLVQAMLNVDIARESGWISAYLAEN